MKILEYHQFAPHIHAFSTERGIDDTAAYTEPYLGFNINPYCGDSASHIAACREELAQLIDVPSNDILLPHQVHGVTVANLDNGDTTESTDALMTTRSRLCIGVSTADCIPVLMHDVRHNAVCAVHSGWRGTVAHVTAAAIEAMHKAYGTERSDLVAVIGPGIRMEAFEVGDEVYEAFAQADFNISRIARKFPAMNGDGEKWHIDLIEAVKSDLQGVAALHDCGICTYATPTRFFSARRLSVNSGRIYNAIMIEDIGGQ